MHPLNDVHQLANEDEARAYLHPVRMRILQLLAGQPLTVSQVAARVGVHPANLTHHFRKLAKARLIRLIEERDTGRVVEKYYRAVAHAFELREENVAMKGAAQRALAALQQDMRAAARQLPPDAKAVICMLANARVSPPAFARFAAKLQTLVNDFRKSATRTGRKNADDPWYCLNVSLYPRYPGPSVGRHHRTGKRPGGTTSGSAAIAALRSRRGGPS